MDRGIAPHGHWLDSYPLSGRAINALINEGFSSAQEVWDKGPYWLTLIENCGKHTVWEIGMVLFGGWPPPPPKSIKYVWPRYKIGGEITMAEWITSKS